APTFLFSSRRRHTRFSRDWSSDVCSSDLTPGAQRRQVLLLVAAASRAKANMVWRHVVTLTHWAGAAIAVAHVDGLEGAVTPERRRPHLDEVPAHAVQQAPATAALVKCPLDLPVQVQRRLRQPDLEPNMPKLEPATA